jgi:hypothetical protein
MAIRMTNRLLGVITALALASGIAAHAAIAPTRPLAPITLPAALQAVASRFAETATGTIDPSAAIRDAYQRDHVALEHLRQQAAQSNGSAHPAFDQYITDKETALAELELTALATSRPDASSTIAAMDNLVSAAQAQLN